MTTLKKCICFILILSMLLVFTSCSAKTDAAPETAPADEPATESKTESAPAAPAEPAEPKTSDTPAAEGLDLMTGSFESPPAPDPDVVFPDIEAEPFVLTGAEWKDNDNWPFFINLINSEKVRFPSFGIEPRNRIKVNVQNASGDPQPFVPVQLIGEDGNTIWETVSDKTGTAYVFFEVGQQPALVRSGGNQTEVIQPEEESRQGRPLIKTLDDITLTVNADAVPKNGLQVMFIIDTTGSMSDEIAYLQKDFSSIAQEAGSDGIEYSVNFYRDEGPDEEYVTKTNPFTSDISKVQSLINAEYADGGGDLPEAVAIILNETLAQDAGWNASANKIAFLIFDAPPHAGTDETLNKAIREAAKKGIKVVPVVASNADRDTELFGRALAIKTNGTYIFLTDDSGVGESHLEPIVGDYTVEKLHDIIVRLIRAEKM